MAAGTIETYPKLPGRITLFRPTTRALSVQKTGIVTRRDRQDRSRIGDGSSDIRLTPRYSADGEDALRPGDRLLQAEISTNIPPILSHAPLCFSSFRFQSSHFSGVALATESTRSFYVSDELVLTTESFDIKRHTAWQGRRVLLDESTMTSVADSVIFRNILSTSESASIWSDATRTSYYLVFEACLARAQGRLGIIPQHAADQIAAHCDISIIDWDELRIQTERIGYPVLGVVKQLVAKVNSIEPGLGEWSHWGATTQDVTDTATILQLRDTLILVESDLESIIATLSTLCNVYKETPMAARSNLQQAVPISFGFKLARLLATFVRHRTRLAEIRSRLLVFEFSGAAGTLATLAPAGGDEVLRCQEEFGKEIGLAVPDIAWHTERDRIAEVGLFFALLTATCAKFALDVKLMMQSEVGEVSEPYAPERGSSSTMPQKRNPISCAYITATSSTVRQLSTSLCEAMVEDHERSTGPWEIEWIVLPQICTLTCSTLRQTSQLLEGLEVHDAKMGRNLKLSKGAIVSEAVMMGLGRTMGRQKAHDLVYDLCRKANQEDRMLVDLLDECDEINLPRQRLEELCDPSNYLGDSAAMVDRVLNLVSSS